MAESPQSLLGGATGHAGDSGRIGGGLVMSRGASLGCMRGQALAELLVVLLVLVPIVVALPLLARYADARQRTLEAARYAAWERTVWADPETPWGEGENTKSDAEIATEIDERLLGGSPVYDADAGTPRVTVSSVVGATPVSTPALRTLAHGLSLGGVIEGVDGVLGALGGCGVGIDIEHGLGLPRDTFATMTVDVPVRGALTGTDAVTLREAGAVLAVPWSSATEDVFRARIDRLALDEPLACIVALGWPFAVIAVGKGKALFGEGQFGLDVEPAADSTVLLSDYVEK